ncbi:hypothetical protein C8Q78DRAFT_993772 [Trametes maxima]|nr:hypothetical protein C8Q78DRAFT_993772 [Trametes maxima]
MTSHSKQVQQTTRSQCWMNHAQTGVMKRQCWMNHALTRRVMDVAGARSWCWINQALTVRGACCASVDDIGSGGSGDEWEGLEGAETEAEFRKPITRTRKAPAYSVQTQTNLVTLVPERMYVHNFRGGQGLADSHRFQPPATPLYFPYTLAASLVHTALVLPPPLGALP